MNWLFMYLEGSEMEDKHGIGGNFKYFLVSEIWKKINVVDKPNILQI